MDLRVFLGSVICHRIKKGMKVRWENQQKLHGTKGKFLNAMIIYRNRTRKRTDQLSVRIQLNERLFVKYANAAECKVPGQHSSSVLSMRKKLCKQDSFNCEEIKTTEMVLYVKNCVLV
jgi:hypothetical protein